MADDVVVVRTFDTQAESQIALAALETAEIDAFLQAETFGGHSPHVAVATGGHKLFVRADDLDRAREILDSTARDYSTDGSPGTCAECGRDLPSATSICPDCNEQEDAEIDLRPRRGRFAVAKLKLTIILFFSALMVVPEVVGWLSGFNITATMLYMSVGAALLLFVVLFVVRRADERL